MEPIPLPQILTLDKDIETEPRARLPASTWMTRTWLKLRTWMMLHPCYNMFQHETSQIWKTALLAIHSVYWLQKKKRQSQKQLRQVCHEVSFLQQRTHAARMFIPDQQGCPLCQQERQVINRREPIGLSRPRPRCRIKFEFNQTQVSPRSRK